MDNRLLNFLVDLRRALGDNGCRTLRELVEYAMKIRAKADEVDAARSAERYLRRLLCLRAGMVSTYWDDGEAQGTERGISIDFMREPVADIDAKLCALNVARAARPESPEADEPEGSVCARCGALAFDPVVPQQAEPDLRFANPIGLTPPQKEMQRRQLAQQAEPVQDLYWRLHSLSKVLEGSGRIDQHDHPDAYATILDAMVMAQQAEPVEPVAWMYTGIKQDGTEHGPHLVWKPEYMDAMSASKGAKATPLYTARPRYTLSEPVEEPAYKVKVTGRWHDTEPLAAAFNLPDGEHLLYTAPPQRKPLTEEEINRATGHCGVSKYTAANITRAVERAHGIKE